MSPQDNLEEVARELMDIYTSGELVGGMVSFRKIAKHFEGEKNKVRLDALKYMTPEEQLKFCADNGIDHPFALPNCGENTL